MTEQKKDSKDLYFFLKDIYDFEFDRFNKSDEKANKYLTLYSILLGFILFIFNYFLTIVALKTCWQIVYFVLIFVSVLIALIFLVISILKLISVLSIYKFKSFDATPATLEHFERNNTEKFYHDYSKQLIEIIEYNSKQNKFKMELIEYSHFCCKWAYIFLLFCVIPLFLSFIIISHIVR